MRKRGVYLILVVVVLAAVLVAVCRREREPSYGGKRLSEWVEKVGKEVDYTAGLGGKITRDSVRITLADKKLAEPFQQMGTNAIPYLLAWMRYEPPAWKTKCLEAMSKVFRTDFLDHRDVRADRAAKALSFLGERADPAVPCLTALMKDGKSPETSRRAQMALFVLGFKLLSANIALMTNSSDWRTELALQNAVGMGTNARPAVPVLLGLLQNSDATVRGVATNALRQIDPEALERAIAGGVGKAERKSE